MIMDKVSENTKTEQSNLLIKLKQLQHAFSHNPYPSLEDRKNTLQKLKKSIIKHEKDFYSALNKDYSYRSEFDTLVGDLLPSVLGINYTIKKLKNWMKPSNRSSGLLLMPSKVKVHYQPLGVVGIIVPWNFPIFLSLGPAIQALAAGNKVMIKLSEATPNVNKVLIEAFACISEHVVVVEGDGRVGADFASLAFDHLLFTGSTRVGRLVAKAAADNLTPTTLELGGKSPVIIANDANLEKAIDSIILGKTLNAGQICIAPDYIFLPQGKEEAFIKIYRGKYQSLFANNKSKNRQTCVINTQQHTRLQDMLFDAKQKGAHLHEMIKKEGAENDRLMYTYILTNVNDSMEVMQSEIFGPILPIIPYNQIDEAIQYINQRPKPLALYIMSNDNSTIDHVLKNTSSGGVCVNDTIQHVAADDAPFGGVGESGMGQYHGHEGFKTFSKARTVLVSGTTIPKIKYFLGYRDLTFKLLRKLFLR